MTSTNIGKSAILMAIIVFVAIACWEFFLRNKGHEISYDNLEPLWADKRARVYEAPEKTTVFIGSSRIKFDLDVPTWEKLTGTTAIQLANEGSNPNPVLQDLANDKNFKGNLIIDVTEGLFFAPPVGPSAARTNKLLKYYKDVTPAQKAGFALNHVLESQFVFLDKEELSLPAMLDRLRIPNRKGVMTMPFFPWEFTRVNFSRQSYMTDALVKDTSLQQKVRNIWNIYRDMGRLTAPVGGDTLRKMMVQVKLATDKIKARGGKILFVRTPSSGPLLKGEQMAFPRQKYWDELLTYTENPGIHFFDYPATNHFICPEWSHLSMQDARIFTAELVRILQTEKGWTFAAATNK